MNLLYSATAARAFSDGQPFSCASRAEKEFSSPRPSRSKASIACQTLLFVSMTVSSQTAASAVPNPNGSTNTLILLVEMRHHSSDDERKAAPTADSCETDVFCWQTSADVMSEPASRLGVRALGINSPKLDAGWAVFRLSGRRPHGHARANIPILQ